MLKALIILFAFSMFALFILADIWREAYRDEEWMG